MEHVIYAEPTDENIRLINLYYCVLLGLTYIRPNSATSHDLMETEYGAGSVGLSGIPIDRFWKLRSTDVSLKDLIDHGRVASGSL